MTARFPTVCGFRRCGRFLGALVGLGWSALGAQDAARSAGFRIEPRADSIRVHWSDGERAIVVAEYRHGGGSRPVVYPLRGLDGVERTRRWPVVEARAGEAKDHPHHRSVWFAHGSVNGIDFWTEGDRKGRVVHVGVDSVAADDEHAALIVRNRWESPAGEIIATDRRVLRFSRVAAGLAFDYSVTVFASHGELTFGDTKEGTMAVRLHPALRLKGKVAAGAARNSEGVTGRAVWGKRARWVDYAGEVDGRTVGVAMFDHPTNPAHPSWWHARDYGLFAANPFGVHDFEKKPKGTGEQRVPAGQSMAFHYRILLHAGADAAALDAAWTEFSAESKSDGARSDRLRPPVTPTAPKAGKTDR